MTNNKERKRKANSLAAYYTNEAVAMLLANLCIHNSLSKVADLSCGEGNLLTASYLRKRDLAFIENKQALPGEQCLLDGLTGVDIDPLAVQKASLALSIANHTRKRIATFDSMDLTPGMIVQSIDGTNFNLEKVDIILMNPPFLRHDHLTDKQKIALRNRFSGYKMFFDRASSLHTYFFFLADQFLLESGRIAFVLPATILRVPSALGIRDFLLRNYTLEHVIFSCSTAAFSLSAEFREVIIIGIKRQPNSESKFTVSFLRRLPSTNEEAKLLGSKLMRFSSSTSASFTDADCSSHSVIQKTLKQNIGNLYSFLCGLDSDLPYLFGEIQSKGSDRLVSVDHILKRKCGSLIRFDYKASFKEAFVIQPSRISSKLKTHVNEWFIDMEENGKVAVTSQLTHQTLKVPRECFAKGLRRSCGVDMIDVKQPDLLIIEPFEGIDALANRIDLSKCKRYVQQRTSNLLLLRKMDISSPGTRLLAFYSNVPIIGVDMWSIKGLSDNDAKIAAMWFNSSIYLLDMLQNRTETTGAWLRLDSSTLSKMAIIDLEKLGHEEKTALLNVFTSVQSISFPSVFEQLQNKFLPRIIIDKLFAKIIGYQDEEIDQVLELLYPALINEIKKLRQLMFQGTKRPISY